MEKRKNPLLSNRIFAFVIDIAIAVVLFLLFDLVSYPIANKVFDYDIKTKQYYQYQVDYELGYYDENNDIVYYEDSDELSLKIEAFSNDENVINLVNQLEKEHLVQYSFDIVIAELISFFILPLILKKGQTLGCKVMHKQIVDKEEKPINSSVMFIRFFIGILIIESIIPIALISLLDIGIIIALAIWVGSCIYMFANKQHKSIIDIISNSTIIDIK